MDALVSRYSRPAYAQNESFEDENEELMGMDPASNLSLKFAMPPVAQVGPFTSPIETDSALPTTQNH